jgi:FlaA1/EpsC-like NDP-sugar epimerase
MSYTDKMLRDDALKGKVIVVTGGGSLGKQWLNISWN